MSDNALFRTPTEEIESLRKEIALVREVLREVSSRLSQIERHAKRALGGGISPRPAASSGTPRRSNGNVTPATLSSTAAVRLFDELVSDWRDHGGDAVSARLGAMDLSDLKLVASELGVPLGNKASKRGLVSAIVRRVNESLLLSINRNVTPPRSEGPDR